MLKFLDFWPFLLIIELASLLIYKTWTLAHAYLGAVFICCQWAHLASLLHLIVWMPELLSAADHTERWQISHRCKWQGASSGTPAPFSVGANTTRCKDACPPTQPPPPLFLFVCLFVSFYCRHCPAVLKLRLFKAVEGIAKTRIFLLIYFYLFYTSKLHFPTCATLLFKCRYFTVLLHHRKVM